jgi:hypothetical protein
MLLAAIILGPCIVGAEETAKHRALFTVLAVEAAPGAWSGYIEVDQWMLVRVIESTDKRFEIGKEYRIGVAVTPGPLFEKDVPQFDSSAVARGKTLSVSLSSECIARTGKKDSFKIAAECVNPLKVKERTSN